MIPGRASARLAFAVLPTLALLTAHAAASPTAGSPLPASSPAAHETARPSTPIPEPTTTPTPFEHPGRTTWLVPAHDTALVSMLLAAEALRQPVLLFDPLDQRTLAETIRRLDRPVTCLHRPRTAPEIVAPMQELAERPCRPVPRLAALAAMLWPEATRAVAVRTDTYEWLLQATVFAGISGSALLPLPAGRISIPDLPEPRYQSLTLVGPPPVASMNLSGFAAQIESITDTTALRERLAGIEPAPHGVLVISNPRDRIGIFSPSALSLLAPLLAIRHRAPMILVESSDPERVEETAHDFLRQHPRPLTHIVLVGDEIALPSHRIPDPVLEAGGPEARGGGTVIRVELFSRIEGKRPQDFAVGRFVAEDAPQASVVLARQLHLPPPPGKTRAEFLVNADEIFALGETISRTTIQELRNVGIPVNAHYREEVTADTIQNALARSEVLVWEGHPRDLTLEERGGIAAEDAPDFVFLQGCYTLDRSDPFILMDKGTTAIVATSAAIYSAPGSAFARAVFDSLLYDGADLGTAVRNGRNYLLALGLLQRNRGHSDWRKTYRAALAFALWGDPTSHPPLAPGKPRRPPARWEPTDGALRLHIPPKRLDEVRVSRYRALPQPRAMLSGLLLKEDDSEKRRVKELYFTVQRIEGSARTACAPSAGWDLVSLWSPQTETLSLLARPDWEILDRPKKPYGTFDFPLAAHRGACAPSPSSTVPAPTTTPVSPRRQS